jgi:drug/metabolite transporter (DMT)-like permease
LDHSNCHHTDRHQVLTNANKFVVILFGIVALHETTTLLSLVGMALSIGGALWYAKARAALAERPRQRGDEDETKPLQQPVP